MASLRKKWQKFCNALDPLQGLDQTAWLSRAQQETPQAVAVVEPEWRGIYSSTRNLFPVILPVKDSLNRRSAERVAELLRATGARRVVISGFPLSFVHLVEALRHGPRPLEVFGLWHGSFVQSNENYNWRSFVTLKDLAERGLVSKLGFVKTGMAEALQRLGIRASFVMNAIDETPAGPSTPLAGGPHFGLWAVRLATWRKLPYAMLVAATAVPGSMLHVGGADERVIEFVREMRVRAQVSQGAVPQAELPGRLREMHLNLYVTFSECCPMVPMESLAVGAPCLLGPTSHLFEDDAYLHSRLVVPYPDRHEVIARYIRVAVEERSEIVAAYRRWLPDYVAASRHSVAEFLDLASAGQRSHAA
ncbi:MAG: hypothetical protein JNG90_16180 [Planctomycetaceae bacterium]|nr:hypothetical protein [Planctomycetaceae bacterium]